MAETTTPAAAQAAQTSSSSGFSLGDSGYAFKTLWQEVTRAVGYIVDGIINVNRDNTQANTEQNAKANDTSLAIYKASNSSNSLFLVIFAVMIIGLLLAIVLMKNKQIPKKG